MLSFSFLGNFEIDGFKFRLLSIKLLADYRGIRTTKGIPRHLARLFYAFVNFVFKRGILGTHFGTLKMCKLLLFSSFAISFIE